jgi:uncharacterized protein involved in exopolysaccharide biosynthesis
MNEEIDIREFFAVIFKRWYLVVISVIILLILFWLPQLSKKAVYEAKATFILKDEGASSASQLSGLTSLLGIGNSFGSKISFPVILSSRAVAEMVLDNVGLQQRIKAWDNPNVNRQDLISAVKAMAKIANKDGLMEISVVNEDPSVAADTANGFVAAGAQYWKKLNETEARNKRDYLENQLPRVGSDLRQAENALKKFTLIMGDDSSPQQADLQGVEMKRLQRELEIQNTAYLMLRKEYESAKLEEAKELAPFSVIDPAEKPLKPLRSKLWLNFVITLVLGSLVGVVLAFGVESLSKPLK